MTRAALYARKSNLPDDGRAESVDRQLQGGQAFVESKQWTLVDSFRDDGVSGARFEGRAGLQRLLAAAEAGQFDVVVVHALDRLGRDTEGTRKVLYRLADAHVIVWQYAPPRQIELTGFEGGILTDIETRFGQWYRDSVRTKVKHTMHAKAAKGEATGPPGYGYRPAVIDGRKDRVIHEAEKKVLVALGERFVNGSGLHALMRWLNGAKIPSATGGRWSAPMVRNILRRASYRGWYEYGREEVRWGRETGKAGREHAQVRRPEGPAVRTRMPHWQIWSDELIARIDARLKEDSRIHAEGRARGKSPHKAAPRNLLSGILTCPCCGGGFQVATAGPPKEGKPGRKVYVCSSRYRKAGTCKDGWLRLPKEETEREILAMIEGELQRRDGLIERLLTLA
jgi:site-specific DNA recombinase